MHGAEQIIEALANLQLFCGIEVSRRANELSGGGPLGNECAETQSRRPLE